MQLPPAGLKTNHVGLWPEQLLGAPCYAENLYENFVLTERMCARMNNSKEKSILDRHRKGGKCGVFGKG